MESRVERAFLDKQLMFGRQRDPLGDRVAMTRPPAERLENQHVQRAANDSAFRIEHASLVPSE